MCQSSCCTRPMLTRWSPQQPSPPCFTSQSASGFYSSLGSDLGQAPTLPSPRSSMTGPPRPPSTIWPSSRCLILTWTAPLCLSPRPLSHRGCKFWPYSLLYPLCGHHPLWPGATKWLSLGVTFSSTTLSKEDHLTNLNAMLICCNHQSANKGTPTLKK